MRISLSKKKHITRQIGLVFQHWNLLIYQKLLLIPGVLLFLGEVSLYHFRTNFAYVRMVEQNLSDPHFIDAHNVFYKLNAEPAILRNRSLTFAPFSPVVAARGRPGLSSSSTSPCLAVKHLYHSNTCKTDIPLSPHISYTSFTHTYLVISSISQGCS